MKTYAIMLSVLLCLTACAGKPAYRAADKGGFGYQQSQLSPLQYRVHFRARGSDTAKAMNYAMLRAAEITLEQGYDWFVVTDRQTLVDRVQRSDAELGWQTSRDYITQCGLLRCTTRSYPAQSLSGGVQLGGAQSSEVESILQIRIGKGVRPETDTSFDARELQHNLYPAATD